MCNNSTSASSTSMSSSWGVVSRRTLTSSRKPKAKECDFCILYLLFHKPYDLRRSADTPSFLLFLTIWGSMWDKSSILKSGTTLSAFYDPFVFNSFILFTKKLNSSLFFVFFYFNFWIFSSYLSIYFNSDFNILLFSFAFFSKNSRFLRSFYSFISPFISFYN